MDEHKSSEHDRLVVASHGEAPCSSAQKLRVTRDPKVPNTVQTDELHSGVKYQRVGVELSAEQRRQGCGQWITVANQVPDSLDCEFAENELLQEERSKRGGAVRPPSWKTWIVLVVIGILVAVVAYGIDQGIKGLQTIRTRGRV